MTEPAKHTPDEHKCERCNGLGHFDDPRRGYTKCPDCTGTGHRRWLLNMHDGGGMRQFRVACAHRNVKGPPKATETHTVSELEDMDMVGIYAVAEATPAGA